MFTIGQVLIKIVITCVIVFKTMAANYNRNKFIIMFRIEIIIELKMCIELNKKGNKL